MNNNVPQEYKPLGAWAYVGYNLLFNIPLVGFIMLIVFALDNSNINRRNYARSFFCIWIIVIAIIVITFIIMLITGASLGMFNNLSSIQS